MRLILSQIFVLSAVLNFAVPAYSAGSRANPGATTKTPGDARAKDSTEKIEKGGDVIRDSSEAASQRQATEAERLRLRNNPGKPAAAASAAGVRTSTGVGKKSNSHDPSSDFILEGGPKTGKRAQFKVDEDTANITKRFVGVDLNAEGVKALPETVVKSAEKTDKIDRDATYARLGEQFNRSTFDKSDSAKVDAAYKAFGSTLDSIKKNLSAAEGKSLEVAINIYLMEAFQGRKPGAKPGVSQEAIAQLQDLLKSFEKELADPKTRKDAMNFILGTLAYYGTDADGNVQLKVAKETWDGLKDPVAREGMAELMGAMAKIHSDYIAGALAKGENAKTMDYEKAWLEVSSKAQDWIAVRLAANGVEVKDIKAMVKSMMCGECNGHVAKKCNL